MEIDQRPRLELETSLDFVNTLEHSENGDRDDLPSLPVAADWLVARGALREQDRTLVGMGTGSDAGLEQVRRLRAALREVVDATVAQRQPDGSALKLVNRTLEAEPAAELVAAPDGVAVVHGRAADPLTDALAHLVEPVVAALADGRPDRLRVCANDSCRWVFFDTSPTGRRRWCDMSTCGNRAKARRHRARARELGGEERPE